MTLGIPADLLIGPRPYQLLTAKIYSGSLVHGIDFCLRSNIRCLEFPIIISVTEEMCRASYARTTGLPG